MRAPSGRPRGSRVVGTQRVQVRGRFLFVGERKFYVRGVTYGPFRPNARGQEYHDEDRINRDLENIAAAGMNVIRTYTVPPRSLLDAAWRYGLRVMIGLPWEQHVTFLDGRRRSRGIEAQIRDGVRRCAGHPAVLAYAVGNEIPPSIVRWYGRRRIECFLERLCRVVKDADPQVLVTYVNFPTTEYLQLPFLDFLCFNVFLESRERLRSYLGRLQNIAEDRPLVMTEVGLDSLRNGEDLQSEVLDWQVRTVFEAGCAGILIFSWTDEWFRGGCEIDDWHFGLTDRDRRPKPALQAVANAFADTPFAEDLDWPRISVVVCTYNGARKIGECFAHLQKLDYPDYEVIVVNDGSSDDTGKLIPDCFRVITVSNGGLSRARNIGLEAASGEIVAFIDDDAYPDPQWLRYIASTFMNTKHVGVGGPNLPADDDGLIASCVAHAPGGPNHVLLSDTVAEHIPGCNMAFRKSALEKVGGFDAQFRIAGDDVDLCWRLQQCGGTLGFNPGAVVWHSRRDSVRGYLRQQKNYGRAEAMLELKWPDKYNAAGHISWQGRLYGTGMTLPLFLQRWRVYHGVWGSGLFQRIYTRQPGLWRSVPLMPEWYLLIAALMLISALGALWSPLLLALPVMLAALGVTVVQAVITAEQARLPVRKLSAVQRIRYRLVIGAL